jgi:hypothetical protein
MKSVQKRDKARRKRRQVRKIISLKGWSRNNKRKEINNEI